MDRLKLRKGEKWLGTLEERFDAVMLWSSPYERSRTAHLTLALSLSRLHRYLSKSNSRVCDVELSVNVLQEGITDEPGLCFDMRRVDGMVKEGFAHQWEPYLLLWRNHPNN